MMDFFGGLVDLLIILTVMFGILLAVGLVMLAAWVALVNVYTWWITRRRIAQFRQLGWTPQAAKQLAVKAALR